MTKQLVNLIGAAATVAILAFGIVAIALPLVSSAGATWSSADEVAAQNRTEQDLLDTLTTQSKDMTSLDAAVAELRAEITPAAYLEDSILLAADAAASHGGEVTSVTVGTIEPFAPRTTVGDAPAPSTESAEEVPADGEPGDTGAATETEETGEAAGVPDAPGTSGAPSTESTSGPQQIEVTIVIDAADVAAATRILDDLRAGPRLVAVTQAGVTSDETGSKLTVTMLLFASP